MDWIANTEIVLDPNNSVIKRLRCTGFSFFSFKYFPTINMCITNVCMGSASALIVELYGERP